MKSVLSILVLFAVICLVVADFELDRNWARYKKHFRKNYKNPREDGVRKEIFRLGLHDINEHNELYSALNIPFTMKVDFFTDLTEDELRARQVVKTPKLIDPEWIKYKAKYHKFYEPRENAARLTLFHKKLALIERHNHDFNVGKVSWPMKVNKFTDMTPDEVKQYGL